MIFGLDDGTAAVWAATIAAIASVVVAGLGFYTRRVVKREGEATREQNSEQHGEGQKLIEGVALSTLDLHRKIDQIDSKVDTVKVDVETLTDRVDKLDGG